MSVCPQINYATRAAAAGLFLFRVRRRKGRHQDQKKTLSRRTDTSKGIDGWHAAQDMSHHTLKEIFLLQYKVSHFCVIFREINALCHRLTGTFPPLLDRESRPKSAFPLSLSLSPPLKNVLGHAQLMCPLKGLFGLSFPLSSIAATSTPLHTSKVHIHAHNFGFLVHSQLTIYGFLAHKRKTPRTVLPVYRKKHQNWIFAAAVIPCGTDIIKDIISSSSSSPARISLATRERR